MSTFKLNTKNDLELFLKVLAEESVHSARATVSQAGSGEAGRQASMIKRIAASKASLSEEDPEKTPPSPAPAAPPPAEEKPAPTPAETSPTPKEMSIDQINPEIGDLVDAIKEIRGGKGSSDSAVEEQLRTYFDRLEHAEKAALVVMMRSIGSIMRQQSTGDQAAEPEQYGIMTTVTPGQEKKAAPAPAAAAPSAPKGASGSAEEDTAPPIRVGGGSPVSEAYRAKIRNLLRNNLA